MAEFVLLSHEELVCFVCVGDPEERDRAGIGAEPPGRRSTSVRDWHRRPYLGAGCRGVTGPVPQPLSMRSGTSPAPA